MGGSRILVWGAGPGVTPVHGDGIMEPQTGEAVVGEGGGVEMKGNLPRSGFEKSKRNAELIFFPSNLVFIKFGFVWFRE